MSERKKELLRQVAQINLEVINKTKSTLTKLTTDIDTKSLEVSNMKEEKKRLLNYISILEQENKSFSKTIEIKPIVLKKDTVGKLDAQLNVSKLGKVGSFDALKHMLRASSEGFFKSKNKQEYNKIAFCDFLPPLEYDMFESCCIDINEVLRGDSTLQKKITSLGVVRYEMTKTIVNYKCKMEATSSGFNKTWCGKKAEKSLMSLINHIDHKLIPLLKLESYKLR